MITMMTVGDLKDKLKDLSDDTPVMFSHPNGNIYSIPKDDENLFSITKLTKKPHSEGFKCYVYKWVYHYKPITEDELQQVFLISSE